MGQVCGWVGIGNWGLNLPKWDGELGVWVHMHHQGIFQPISHANFPKLGVQGRVSTRIHCGELEVHCTCGRAPFSEP